MSADDLLSRLRHQLDAVPALLAGVAEDGLRARSPSGKWSARENLAHIARYHDVFSARVRRILEEHEPIVEPYRAENDSSWPSWASLDIDGVRERLRGRRAALVAQLEALAPDDFERVGVHGTFGRLTLATWVEFFLVHEAHHLYVAMRRARGLD